MTTRSKNLGRVAGPRPLHAVPAWMRVGPCTEVPRRAGTKAFAMSSWEETGLVEVENGRPCRVDREGSAMPKSRFPGPGHPPSNRANGEISAGNQTACDTPSKSCPLEPSAGRTCLASNKTLATIPPSARTEAEAPHRPAYGLRHGLINPWATLKQLPETCLMSSPLSVRSRTRRSEPRRIHPQPQLKGNRCAFPF